MSVNWGPLVRGGRIARAHRRGILHQYEVMSLPSGFYKAEVRQERDPGCLTSATILTVEATTIHEAMTHCELYHNR